MESLPTQEQSSTLNVDIAPANGGDSHDHPDTQIQSSDPQSIETPIPVGEKRKREEVQDGEDVPASKTPTEAPSDPTAQPLWKTSLCSYFRRHSGSCSHGSTCRYAHGEEELRPRPDNTWDPTSERAKKVMKAESEMEVEDEVLMTEMVVDEDEGDGGGSDCVMDPALSKCLVHIPRRWHSDDLRKFLQDQDVQFKSAKKKKGMTVAFLRFETTEQLKSAVEALQGKTVGNKNLKVADVIPRAIDKNIKSAMGVAEGTHENVKSSLAGDDSVSANVAEDGETYGDGVELKEKTARDAVTPLAHMTYSEQLEHKKSQIKQMLKKLTRNARKACPNGVSLPQWVLKSKDIGGLACELEGIIESPLVNGYRNKCEFSVGLSLQGKPTVGFMLGNFRKGVTAVMEPTECPNVSRIACKYALIFQDFLQTSTFPIWNRFKNVGFWRQLTVREGRKPRDATNNEDLSKVSEVMLIVQVCTTGFDDAQIATEFEKLAQAFVEGAETSSPTIPLTALVVQNHQGISNAAPGDAPLSSLSIQKSESSAMNATDKIADPRIHDYISNLCFSISPTAFFQVNTLGAEKLYSLAGDWAGLGPDTLLFDICCGTGTIGLILAHSVGMVIGIEMNASAIADAHRNAEINGIKNCKFVCSKAEDVIGSLLKEYLHVPEKRDDPNNNESEIIPPEVKSISMDNISDAKECLSNDPVNGKTASADLLNGVEEVQSINLKSSILDEEKSSIPQFKNVVAIVDPPRGGLHPTVIKALRTNPRLRRLVYISCNPETLVANAIELCTPSPETIEKGKKDNRGWRNMSSAGLARHRAKSMPISEPFRPVKAMAVDLFPHTDHCELVMLLER